MITAVAHPIANHSSIDETLARSIAILVANAAINVFTKLLITKIVIRNLSVLSFNRSNFFAEVFHFLISASIRCLGIDIIAISLPAENAEKPNNTTNVMIVHELIKIKIYGK